MAISAALLLVLSPISAETPSEPVANDPPSATWMLGFGTDIPLQWVTTHAGVTLPFGLGFELSSGFLTPPYSDAILGITLLLGLDEPIVELIRGAFQAGFLWEAGLRYQIPGSSIYFGLAFSHIVLFGSTTPVDALDSVIGLSLDNEFNRRPNRPRRPSGDDDILTVTLQSQLFNLKATLFGFHWAFHPNVALDLELALTKTLGSVSTFSSGTALDETPEVQALYAEADQFLNESYQIYVWAPSINAVLLFKFD